MALQPEATTSSTGFRLPKVLRRSQSSAEGFVYPDSRCCSVIFMDQPAKSIDADDCAIASAQGGARLRRLEREAAVRPLFVVVAQVLLEDALRMALPEDQDVIQALPSHRLHEAFSEGIRLRRADGRADDVHALTAKYLIERATELGVAIADQEADRRLALIQPKAQVACLLGDPRRVRMGADAGKVNPSCGQLDEEQYVERSQPDALHGEEVAGQDTARLAGQELLPRGSFSPWGGRKAVANQQRADRRRRDNDAELAQFTLDAPIPPARVLLGQAQDERGCLAAHPRASWSPLPTVGPLAPHQFAMPTQQRPR